MRADLSVREASGERLLKMHPSERVYLGEDEMNKMFADPAEPKKFDKSQLGEPIQKDFEGDNFKDAKSKADAWEKANRIQVSDRLTIPKKQKEGEDGRALTNNDPVTIKVVGYKPPT